MPTAASASLCYAVGNRLMASPVSCSLRVRQILLGDQRSHIWCLRQRAHLDERARQHVKRLGVEPSGPVEHSHQLVVVTRGDALRDFGGAPHDLDRLGAMLA